MSLRDGSRRQSPPRPDDIAWHCANVSKLQESTLLMMSLRQYSYVRAEAGVAMATRVNAPSAATEVPINSKRLSMSFFLSTAWVLERIASSRAMR